MCCWNRKEECCSLKASQGEGRGLKRDISFLFASAKKESKAAHEEKKDLANIAFLCVSICLSTRAYRFTAVRLKFSYNFQTLCHFLPFLFLSLFDGHCAASLSAGTDDASLYSFFIFISCSPSPVLFGEREREREIQRMHNK